MNARLLALVCWIATVGVACPAADEAHHDPHDADHAAEGPARGARGGRLLRDGSFVVELVILERGVPPEYHAWVSVDEKPIDPEAVDLVVELERFGGRTDRIRFAEHEDHLRGDRTVEEPHSFVVTVRAEAAGERHEWRYESFEGRTSIPPDDAAASGIGVEIAGPARIQERLHAVGRVTPDLEKLARIVAPYPGIVRKAERSLGDAVAEGELLAVIEAAETLRRYEIRSPIAGTILSRDASAGEMVTDRVVYTVADLSTLWIDLRLKPSDAARVRAGQPVEVRSAGDLRADAEIELLSPEVAADTQTVSARAVMSRSDPGWKPGLFVRAEIIVDDVEVPVAVRPSALQTFREQDVVFLNDGPIFQAIPVELGRRDARWVEILSGVEAGRRYAATGSFVIKADVEKSGAGHDH
jgi:membrane fusion protein, heavy metal efflux system